MTMCSVALSILFFSLVESHANIEVLPLDNSDLSGETLAVVPLATVASPGFSSLAYGLRIPQGRLNSVPIGFSTPQVRPNPQSSSYTPVLSRLVGAFAEEASKEEKAPAPPKKEEKAPAPPAKEEKTPAKEDKAKPAPAAKKEEKEKPAPAPAAPPKPKFVQAKAGEPANIYGSKLSPCGDEKEMCVYEMGDRQFCGTIVATNSIPSYGIKKDEKCSDIMSEYTYVLGKSGTKEGEWGRSDQGYVKNGKWIKPEAKLGYEIQCNAIPAGVLDSQYSLDRYAESAAYQAKIYKTISQNSREYTSQKDAQVTTDKNPFYLIKPSLGEGEQPKLVNERKEKKINRFRESILNLCEICAGQTTEKEAQDALASKCAAIQAGAAAEAATTLSSESSFQNLHQGMGITAVMLIGLIVGGRVVSKKLGSQHNALNAAQKPFLSA